MKLTHVSAAFLAGSLSAACLAGCAVSAAPDTTPEPESDVGKVAPRSASPILPSPLPILPICLPPITPTTGDWSCGSSGVRTGEKSVTTTAGYTNNCAGRATVQLSMPKCPVPGPSQYDELYVSASGLTASIATACAAAYLDYSISGISTSTDAWSTIESGRIHGTFTNGICELSLWSYPASASWSEIQISADAYEVVQVPFDGTDLSLTLPVNVYFDASFFE